MLGICEIGRLGYQQGQNGEKSGKGQSVGGQRSYMPLKQHRAVSIDRVHSTNLLGLCSLVLLWSGENTIAPVTCYGYASSVSDFYHWSA